MQIRRILNYSYLTFSYLRKNSIYFHISKKGVSKLQLNRIHTSESKYVNPALVAVLRPLGKFAAALIGRGFRKWWKSLPKEKRKLFVNHFLQNKWKYFGICGLSSLGGYSYCLNHVTVTPLTDRKRFILFDTSELRELSEAQFIGTLEANKDFLLPQDHPSVNRVKNVATKILKANKDLPQIYSKFWTITVIDVPEENCFVFPTGQIVMFTGMLSLLENDDQLAVILAHEMSHAILEHAAEMQSYYPLLDFLKIFPIALIWAFMPSDLAAGATHYIFNKIFKMLAELPYSRLLEEEADVMGLFLMASACYDVREASAFWGGLQLMNSFRGDEEPFPWVSTHPSHLKRQSILDAFMQAAIQTRERNKCSALKKIDPRISITLAQKRLNPNSTSGSCCSDEEDKILPRFGAIVKKFSPTAV